MAGAAKYQPYPAYQSSYAVWSGDVPEHWVPIRLKHVFSEKKKRLNPSLPAGSISFGNVIFKNEDSLAKETKAAYQEVLAGEFLINPLNMNFDLISLRTALSSIDVVVSTGYLVLQSHEGYNKNYLRWLLQQFDVAHMKTLGAGVRQTISFTDIGNSFIFEPPLPEQTKIAAFLDYETAKIDALIAKQQRLIALLEEKRQAVISHAVTKGLNPTAPLRPSGIDWLGDVPAHWNVVQARRIIAGMEQGKSPDCHNFPAASNKWGVLKSGCVNGGHFSQDENKELPDYIRPAEQYEVSQGDILMSRASGSVDLIGSVAYVENTRAKLLLSDKTFRIKLSELCAPKFFVKIMSTYYIRDLIKQSISGAEGMANNITKASILSFPLTLPPASEQTEIIDFIDGFLRHQDVLLSKVQSAITLLKERRTALISAAVTGKIDLRDWPASAEAQDTVQHEEVLA